MRLSLAMVMPHSTNANVAVVFDSDACDASCFVCHYMFESGDNSWDMVTRLRLIEYALEDSLANRMCNVRACWFALGALVHAKAGHSPCMFSGD